MHYLYFVLVHVSNPLHTVSAQTECMRNISVYSRNGRCAKVLVRMVTQFRQCKKRDVLTNGMSVTFVTAALAVRRLLFDKLVPSNSLTTGLQLPNALAC